MNGIDRLFSGMRSSSSGLMAERVRIDVIAENIANARTTSTPEGGPYRRKVVVFEPLLQDQLGGGDGPRGGYQGVRAARIVPDTDTPTTRLQEPGHPDADAEGYVTYPNVSVVEEMANMMSASRSFQINVEVMNTAKSLAERLLTLGQ